MEDKRNKEVIIVIVSVIVIILVFYLFISPTITALKKSNYTIATKGADLKNAEENLSNLKSLQSTFTSKSNEIKALLSALPSFTDTEDLITTLEAAATKDGMQMTSIVPEQAGEEGTAATATSSGAGFKVAETSYDLTVMGSYQGLVSFITDLESNRRPLNITQIAISAESTGTSSPLNVVISLTAYYSTKS